MLAFDLYPRKCCLCGRKFEAGKDWVFRIEDKKGPCKWFCSWKCLRLYRADHKERRRNGKEGDYGCA